MASTKRENPGTEEQKPEDEPQVKRLKNPSENLPNFRVVLNPADSDLAFNIGADGLTGDALYEEGFAYCWSGARGSVGITGGKYYFGCRVVSHQPVKMEDTLPEDQNVCRIGISRGADPVGCLGETNHSFGFGGTGKFSNAARFVNYGERFGVGDTIICLVDLESQPSASIEFCKNGRRLGIAKHFDASPKGPGVIDSSAQNLPWESALFPHVLLKNVVVETQFSVEDGLIPIEGYKPWASAVNDEKAINGPSLAEPTNCEVIMMVGLPASGKSTWAEKWVKEHPEKRYVLLGTNLAMDQMKVSGLLRKHNYGERFDRLMDRATGIFNTLLSRASKVPRNYILDQTNVYKGARRRKLKPFAFCHKIAVVVFPSAEELKLRSEKRFRDMGKDVPAEAVDEMLANFVLPKSKDMHGTDEYFDEVIFTDLNRFEAQQHLDEMKRKLVLSSSDKPRSDQYPRESSVQSDSGLAAHSFPGHGHAYPRFPDASAGVGGIAPGYLSGSYPGSPAPTYPSNVHAMYDTYASPYQGSLNPVPGRDAYQGAHMSHDQNQYGGYVRDPLSIQPYGPSGGFTSNPDGRSSANQYSSYGPRYDAPSPSPYGLPTPYAASPRYDAPTPSPYGLPPPYAASPRYDAPTPSPYGHPYPVSGLTKRTASFSRRPSLRSSEILLIGYKLEGAVVRDTSSD